VQKLKKANEKKMVNGLTFVEPCFNRHSEGCCLQFNHEPWTPEHWTWV